MTFYCPRPENLSIVIHHDAGVAISFASDCDGVVGLTVIKLTVTNGYVSLYFKVGLSYVFLAKAVRRAAE